MSVAAAIEKMTEFYKGNLHDVAHFMKVWGFARTIGQLEGLAPQTQLILEYTAVVHDIACPLCREKYGNTNGKFQELEGATLTRAFFADTGIPAEQLERIVWLVSHHHTLRPIEGPDHQILIEADYLVNAEESNLPESNIRHMNDAIFKTRTGKELLESVYLSH